MFIRKTYKIEYAHRVYNQKYTVWNTDTPCRNFHGHSGKVVVELSSERLNEEGMVIDFTDLKPVKDFINLFDHSTIISADDPDAMSMFVGNNDLDVLHIGNGYMISHGDGIIVLHHSCCSSEVISVFLYHGVANTLKLIEKELGLTNGVFLNAIEFSETDNNVVRYHGTEQS